MTPLWIAIQFLTRIPVRLAEPPTPQQLARSLALYPVVGAIIGILLWLCAEAMTDFDPLLRAAMLVGVWVAITGGLHLDGLADSADACAGAHGAPQRARAILKDPSCGAMGVVALVMVLMLKFATLAHLPAGAGIHSWLLPPVLARAAVIGLFLTTPYVSQGGLGTALADPGARRGNLIALGLTVAAVLIPDPDPGARALSAALIVFLVTSWTLRHRFGGANGDGAGALVELTETAVLVTFAAVTTQTHTEIGP